MWGKSARQKEQQVQVPDADVLLVCLEKKCKCFRKERKDKATKDKIKNWVVLQKHFVLFGPN